MRNTGRNDARRAELDLARTMITNVAPVGDEVAYVFASQDCHAPALETAIPAFLASLTSGRTRTKYQTELTLFLERFGDTPLGDLSASDIARFIHDQVQNAARNEGFSTSKAEAMTTAFRSLEAWAIQQPEWHFPTVGHLLRLEIIRDPDARRALEPDELLDTLELLPTLCPDPLLVRVGLQLFRETAVRRGTSFALEIGDLRLGTLDPERLLDIDHRPDHDVYIKAPIPKSRRRADLRITRPLAAALLSVHERNPAEPKLLKYGNGSPIGANFWHAQFQRLDAERPWAAEIDMGPHYLRHTTLTDVERIAGTAVSRRFGTHAPSARDAHRVYTKASRTEVFAVHRLLFGA